MLGTAAAAMLGAASANAAGRLSREETLAGIRTLWEAHAAELPRAAAAQIGAIYARYSTKGQSSVLDQVRTCLEFAAREGIHVPLELVFFDLGVSGRKARRAGYQELEACLAAKTRPQALLVFTTSRLHRRALRALDFVETLVTERRMRVAFVMNRIDSRNDDQWKRFLMFLALQDEFAAEMYVENIRASHIGKLLGRLVFGTVTFGYRGVEVPGSFSKKGKPARRVEVDPAESAVVTRVFEAFVRDCLSIRGIIQTLNADPDVPPPRKGKGQWTRLAVVRMLRNHRYRGLWAYGARESVLLSSKDYVRQIEREVFLRQVHFEELRVVPDALFFEAQKRLAELRPDRGREPNEEHRGRLPLVLNGLVFCPGHDRPLTVGGSHGEYLVCPACEREGGERRHLVSHLNRVTALKRICEVLADSIQRDEGLVGRIVENFRRAAAALQAPDPGRREALLERRQRLARSVRLLTRQEPASDAEERELEAGLREKRIDLAGVESELAWIDCQAGRAARVPTDEEIAGELREISDTLLRVAAEGPPEETGPLKELLKRLTGGRVDVSQRGERKPRRGWLEGRFRAPLVGVLSRSLNPDAAPDDADGIELVVSFRRDDADADQVDRAWELRRQGMSPTEIAASLGCSKSNVTRLLKKAAARGETLEDGRKRRRTASATPASVTIGDQAAELWNSGAPYHEIGRACGVSDATAEQAVRRWHEGRGLPAPTPESRRRDRLAAAEWLRGEGLSWEAVAERLGVSTATLRAWRERAA